MKAKILVVSLGVAICILLFVAHNQIVRQMGSSEIEIKSMQEVSRTLLDRTSQNIANIEILKTKQDVMQSTLEAVQKDVKTVKDRVSQKGFIVQ